MSVYRIYGTYDQYNELQEWCKKNNPKLLDYFLQRNPFYTKTKQIIIAVFPEEISKWLLKNCDIVFVINQILEQYGLGDIF